MHSVMVNSKLDLRSRLVTHSGFKRFVELANIVSGEVSHLEEGARSTAVGLEFLLETRKDVSSGQVAFAKFLMAV